MEGYYSGNGAMLPVLMNEGLGSNNYNTDSINVELRSPSAPYNVAASLRTMLHTDGTATCLFSPLTGSYYVVIRHRNTLPTWSANSILLGSSPTSYDFTTAANKAYGNNMKPVGPGQWALFTGELIQDENIDLLDISPLENDINNFISGINQPI
ncbi:hypothetical protein EMGBS15_09650 [Filimonas sp.]|nr:hypothetical protein EMGBS15_09650 [Filimonas sp.]